MKPEQFLTRLVQKSGNECSHQSQPVYSTPLSQHILASTRASTEKRIIGVISAVESPGPPTVFARPTSQAKCSGAIALVRSASKYVPYGGCRTQHILGQQWKNSTPDVIVTSTGGA